MLHVVSNKTTNILLRQNISLLLFFSLLFTIRCVLTISDRFNSTNKLIDKYYTRISHKSKIYKKVLTIRVYLYPEVSIMDASVTIYNFVELLPNSMLILLLSMIYTELVLYLSKGRKLNPND